MKYCSLFVMCCLVSMRAYAYTDFMNNIDNCSWISNEQKTIFKISPPFKQYAEDITKQRDSIIQKKCEIDLDKAKEKAIQFYEKYLAEVPELLNIAKDVIRNGTYSYGKNALDSSMKIILGQKDSWSKEVQKELYESSIDAEENVEHELNEILSGKYCPNYELHAEIKSKYMNKRDIVKNFGIEVQYNNKEELPIQIIHETAHVLDIAYRIIENIISPTTDFNNKEAVAVFFETTARRDFGMQLLRTERLNEIYRDMIQHDYLRRLLNSSTISINKVIGDVKKAWQSPLDKEINYVDLDEQETAEALTKIKAGECFYTQANEYLHHVGRALEIIQTNGITPITIGEMLKNIVTIPTPPLATVTYGKILECIKYT